jgi:uncharacterized protein (DUF1015 family)
MATIKPFRGVRYNPERIPDLSYVVSQPHDRMQHGLQDKYYELSPYNIVRIIKGKEERSDNGSVENVYTRARDAYQSWLQEGILKRDESPAFYVLQQTFSMPDGSVKTRLALIAALELTFFEEGIVLPHERTLAKSMAGRLNLVRAAAVNFGCVFMLYPGGGINEILAPAVEKSPPLELRELHEKEVLQRFWPVTDPDVITTVIEKMVPRRHLIIADGHHRYETALTYRGEMRSKYLQAPASAAFNYRLVALVSMDDPGLVILPTHRLIHAHTGITSAEALARAKAYFEVKLLESPEALEAALAAGRDAARPSLGLYDGTSALLTLRDPEVMVHLLPHHTPDWRTLDIAVVHELFIERVLGIDKRAIAHDSAVEFLRDPQMGYDAVNRGEANFFLVMNPTRIEQVRACTAAGERMPQKSTDFYPKMISGLVALPVDAEETL